MSKSRFILSQCAAVLCPILGTAAWFAGAGVAAAQTSTGWLGDGATELWSDAGNWSNGIPGGAVTDLQFGAAFLANPGGANFLLSQNDLAGFIGYRLTFEDYAGTAGFTITGAGFTLAADGANAPRIQNDSAFLQTISTAEPVTLDGGAGAFAELNAVQGDLSLETTPVVLAGVTELRVSAAAGKTVSLLGNLSGGGGLVKTGAGVLQLGTFNSFTGQIQVKAGTISVDLISANGFESSLGAGSQPLILGDVGGATGTLRFTGFGGSTDKPIAIATGGIGAVSVVESSVLALSGAVTGSGAFLKTGLGDLILSGANTYTGGTVISQGALNVGSASALGTGTITLGDADTGSANVKLFHQGALGTTATEVIVSAAGTGLAQVVWSQDWAGNVSQTTATANSLKFTLNRMVNFQTTVSGKQILPYITGPGAGAGNVTIKIDGGTQVTLTAATNSTNSAVIPNDFVGNVWITGNTRFQSQNRSNQGNVAAFYNGVIPDASTVIVDPGSTWQLHHGVETIGFLSGGGTVSVGGGTVGNALAFAGSSTTPTTSPTTLGIATFSGTLSNAEGGITKNGTGIQDLSGPLITYATGTTINDGALRLTNVTGWQSTITLGAANNPTLQFNAANAADSWTFGKTINGGSVTARIEKVGPGVTILTPAAGSTFVGSPTAALTVTEGSLFLNSAFTTLPSVSVGPAGRFGGQVTVGNVTVAAGGGVEGGQGGLGALTVGNLTFSGAGGIYGALAAGTVPLVVTGALAAGGGSQSISASITGTLPGNGTYHLLQFGSSDATLDTFKFPTAVRSLVLALNGNFLDVIVDSSNAPIWTGVGGSEWSTNILTPKNWKQSANGAGTDFLPSDAVTFDDTATGSTDIQVGVTNVSPTSIRFANSDTDYTLSGPGDITQGALVKEGNGLLTINDSFSFSGGARFKGGIVSILTETGVGTGARIFDGGTLRYTGDNATWARSSTLTANGGTLDITNAGTTIIHTAPLTGPAGSVFTKAGPGTLQLGAGTLDADLNIANGTVVFTSAAGAVTLNGKITGLGGLSFYGNNVTTIGGTAVNDFGGEVNIYGYQIFLNKPAGSNGAIAGNINIRNGNWPVHGVTIQANEQIADSAVFGFFNTNNAYDFRLNGHTETIAGITSTFEVGVGAIIENAGYQGGNDTGINAPGTLIVSGPDTYTFYGQLRNQNGGSNGVLNFVKAGPGTQELVGPNPGTYTGTTTVTGGTLRLVNTTAFASETVTVTDPGTLELSRSQADWTFSKVVAGTGSVVITADAGIMTMSAVSSYTGPTFVRSGILNLAGTLSGSPVTVEAGATLQGIGHAGGLLTVAAGGIFNPATSTGGFFFADGGVKLESDSVLYFDLNGADPSSGDLVKVMGNLTLDGGLTINDLSGGGFFNAAPGTTWRLFEYSGTLTDNELNLSFMPALPDGFTFAVDTSVSGQVNLAVVPEPGAVCALLGGLAVLLSLRRRSPRGRTPCGMAANVGI